MSCAQFSPGLPRLVLFFGEGITCNYFVWHVMEIGDFYLDSDPLFRGSLIIEESIRELVEVFCSRFHFALTDFGDKFK